LELRNETIACLALPDLRTVKEWEATSGGVRHFSLDCQYFAQGYSDGQVAIQRVTGGDDVTRLPGSGFPITELRFSPDSQLLAVASAAKTRSTTIWDWHAAKPVFTPAIGGYRVAAFTSDNRLVAVAELGESTALRVYELPSGHELWSDPAQPLVYSLEFHPKEPKLAVSTASSAPVRILDGNTGVVLQSLNHPSAIYGLAWHPEGKVIAAAGSDGRIYLWDTTSGESRGVLAGH
jgi:WD40 repeat protein